ncbi:MAG: vitamin K epoxide reductase family protein [Candidatus Iainarchaeum archaeon]|uniref:Vitamin K epoxide reductase family protein n=1 Tax=Candidatus Iainarchaeum sp. TaxID=3101447 RepID=A0A7T9DKK4_9ARCH|nr:MAG: vitamin K epoxide reductase family protein [Candidatus Diapherotrites archaeon]
MGIKRGKSVSPSRSSVGLWFKLIIVFTLIAIGADAMLTYNKLTDSAVGCPAGGGCDIVKGSIYSEFFGIPVSLFGMGAFIAFLVLVFLAWHRDISNVLAFDWILILSGIGLLVAIYFVYIMLFVLEAICNWCFLSHFMLLFVFISAYQGRKESHR